MTTGDRFSSPAAAEQVSRARPQDVRCCSGRDVNASPVDTLLGAHFCTFARFVTGLQTLFPPPRLRVCVGGGWGYATTTFKEAAY